MPIAALRSHLAAAGNHAAVAKLLLFNGADPSAIDCNGLSPLETAEGTEELLTPPLRVRRRLRLRVRRHERARTSERGSCR